MSSELRTEFDPTMIGKVVTVKAKAEGFWGTVTGRLASYGVVPDLTGFQFEHADRANRVDEIASIEVFF